MKEIKLVDELQRVLTPFTHETPGVERPLQVRRSAVLPLALKAVRRSSFCFRDIPIVSFSGEETEGHQGPLREFFRLTLDDLQETSLFEGRPGRLLLTSDLSALEDWGYYEAGVLIGWSLAHGGAGPRCLHPALFQLMCGHSSALDDFSWRDVEDFEIQSHLQQLQTCSDARLLSPGVCEWASRCGVSELSSAAAEEIPQIYRRVVKHHIHDRVSGTIDQFTQGLNSCDGLWDVISAHMEAFAPVMTSVGSGPLALPSFRALFTV
ncbi:G2/M phase-specific E3 ubiquitin-protein ligase-like [Eucyclogobius newberryi]|uniref:G2/M phase-specific E3 ubiquitin-protein ligase-like n=1 Tax=Eucyclogobius newberryi TaxID=166745 RepID=UPI003B5B4AB4